MLSDVSINKLLSDMKAGNPVFVEIVRGPRSGSIAKVVNIPSVPQRESWRIELDGRRTYISSRLLKPTDETTQFDSSKVVREHYDILGRKLEIGQMVAYIGPIGPFGQEICIGTVSSVDSKVRIVPKVAPALRKLGDFKTAKSNTSILIVENNELEPFILQKMFSND